MTVSTTSKEYKNAQELYSKFPTRAEWILKGAFPLLKAINVRFKKELAYSKDLRNQEALTRIVSERAFVKAQIVIGNSIANA